jgi:hyperosmotically inducible periplasmic protein
MSIDAREIIEDSIITTNIKTQLMAKEMLSALNISVETHSGIVFLKGSVSSSAQADTAIEIASSVEGVVDVNTSQLSIEDSPQPLVDSFITAKIKGLYLREKLLGETNVPIIGIHVETKDGIVYLTGKVDKRSYANDAEKLAKSVQGVKEVKSNIAITSE